MDRTKPFGLVLPKKDQKSRPKTSVVFGSDSDDEPPIQNPKLAKIPQIQMKKEDTEDPSIYEYDSIYDDMKAEKAAAIAPREDKPSRYIESLLKAAVKRKKEQERRVEKKVQVERVKEGDKFKDKEAFVTTAYRKKMQEMEEEEERERRENALNEMMDVTKQKDLSGFYRHFLKQSIGEEKIPVFGEQIPVIKKEEVSDSENETVLSSTKKPGKNETMTLPSSTKKPEKHETMAVPSSTKKPEKNEATTIPSSAKKPEKNETTTVPSSTKKPEKNEIITIPSSANKPEKNETTVPSSTKKPEENEDRDTDMSSSSEDESDDNSGDKNSSNKKHSLKRSHSPANIEKPANKEKSNDDIKTKFLNRFRKTAVKNIRMPIIDDELPVVAQSSENLIATVPRGKQTKQSDKSSHSDRTSETQKQSSSSSDSSDDDSSNFKVPNDVQNCAKDKVKSSKVTDKEEKCPEEPKKNIYEKRTVGIIFYEAQARYFQRLAARSS